MDNAAKALLIAGGVFLAIMTLSIGVYLRGRLQNSADTYVETLDAAELRKYNSNFEVYADASMIITAQDIVTMIGEAQKAELGTKIIVNDVDYSGYNEKQKHEFLENNILKRDEHGNYENAFSYVDNSLRYDKYGRVEEIKFKKD